MNLKQWFPLTLIQDEILNRVRVAHVFGTEVLFLTYDDEVLAFGANNQGCLGLEDTEPRYAPDLVTELYHKRVKSFTFGGSCSDDSCSFVLALTFTGAVYFCGGKEWISDNNGVSEIINKPALMTQLTTKVIQVACGKMHCLALNTDGEVFSWGVNDCGQLGIDSYDTFDDPRKVEKELTGKRVIKISCGEEFSLAVLDSGEVFAWGSNVFGQLGLNETAKRCSVPKRVTFLNNSAIKKVVCGQAHVLAVNDVFELFVWGDNVCGELGLGDFQKCLIPTKNMIVKRVTKIAAFHASRTCAALTDDSKVYMWGSCHGLNISVPQETPYKSLHEVFANFSTPCCTYKSLRVRMPELGHKSISGTLRNAFEDKESSDLIIVAEGKEIFVHRLILRLRSDYFRTLLQEHWNDKKQKYVDENYTYSNILRRTKKAKFVLAKNVDVGTGLNIPPTVRIKIDQSYNAIYAYLKYLYTDELNVELNLALELLAVVNEYDDRPMKKLCVKIIQREITIDNVAALYSVALKFSIQKLLNSCLIFAGNNLSALVRTSSFDDWDPNTVKDFFRECGKRKLFRS